MEKIRITAISYLNSIPFIFGLQYSKLLHNYELLLEVPSNSANNLMKKKADIGLVPVGALPLIKDYKYIGNKCIGAVNNVKTVVLISNSPLPKIKKIYLDSDSMTSVNLVKILAKNYWNILPAWENLLHVDMALAEHEGMLIIGDKTFMLRDKYEYCYDLAGEWIKFTGLPFVFAVWISVNAINTTFLAEFETALQWGVSKRNDSLFLARNKFISDQELIDYLNNDIDYELDDSKKTGMELFLRYLKEV